MMRIRIFLLTIVFLLLLSTFVPVSSQLFDDSDVKDPQGVLDHFRSRIKQVRNVFSCDFDNISLETEYRRDI